MKSTIKKLRKYSFIDLFLYATSLLFSKQYYCNRNIFQWPYTIRNIRRIKLGKYIKASPYFFAESHNQGEITINNGCIFNRSAYITCSDSIIIGRDCLFGPNLFLSDHDHGSYFENEEQKLLSKPVSRTLKSKPVRIGKCVWVGSNVCILKGVSIGDGCIIGSKSVVTKSIPKGSMVVGSPARIIKKHKKGKWKKINE